MLCLLHHCPVLHSSLPAVLPTRTLPSLLLSLLLASIGSQSPSPKPERRSKLAEHVGTEVTMSHVEGTVHVPAGS